MISELINLVMDTTLFIFGQGSSNDRPEKEKIISNLGLSLTLVAALVVTLLPHSRIAPIDFFWIIPVSLSMGFILLFIPLRLRWVAPWRIATYIKASLSFSCLVWIAILIFIF
ncbi:MULTISPECIES: hypothetical protein [Sphingobacterium]|jgi:hypothetical protein|nr:MULTISPECIES: hypothetical protein [Sphingobacterium]APU96168.1 hypothetical protein BV902_07280 [Sphingobacterium sp. B29]TWI21545.1 hypothetical protein IQ31_01677 [Sphingobacterium siyangense]UQA76543.1 hypothetical protein K2F45_05995 [Sphingobacterium siyangense]HBI90200.1 hypothetical protein [Sphingobacterium sp.]